VAISFLALSGREVIPEFTTPKEINVAQRLMVEYPMVLYI
jgi:hypothetical protein